MMMVQTDSDRTSVSPGRLLPFFVDKEEPIGGEVRIGQVTIAQPEGQSLNWVEPGSELSTRRKPFNANVIFSGPSRISVIDAYRQANSYFVFDFNSLTFAKPIVQTHPNKSSYLSKTNETWVVWNTFDLEASKSLAELRSIISGIGLGVVPQRSQEFEELLRRALAVRGQPEDVDQWARRLAQDVSNLDD